MMQQFGGFESVLGKSVTGNSVNPAVNGYLCESGKGKAAKGEGRTLPQPSKYGRLNDLRF